MVKKNRMTIAQTNLMSPFSSPKRLEKNSGIVSAFFDTNECFLSLFATNSQEQYDPMSSPTPIQTCPRPAMTIEPGSPMRSHPLISDACADIALTYGPRDLLPRM